MTNQIDFDSIIDPVDDFDEFVNGKWMKTTQIPDDQHDWGTFNILHEENLQKIKLILNELFSNPSSPYHVLGIFYETCMKMDEKCDTVIKDQIIKFMEIIDMAKNIEELGTIIGFLTRIGIDTFFTVSASEDPKNTETVKLTLSNIGLSLPERNYYIESKFQSYVDEFKAMVTKLFMCFDYCTADAEMCASNTFMIEEMIATVLKPAAERREFDKLYCNLSVTGFIDIMMNTDEKIFQSPNGEEFARRKKISNMWNNFFKASDLSHVSDLIAYDLSYFRKMTILIQIMPLKTLKHYIKYVTIKNLGSTLMNNLDDTMFLFFGKKLQGQIANTPRSNRIINYLSLYAGEILGKEYVTKFTNPQSIEMVRDMITKIQTQMKLSIDEASWLENTTKQKALKKLNTFTTKIGYPEVWRDHTELLDEMMNVIELSENASDVRCAKTIFKMSICMRMYSYKINIIDVVDKAKDPNKWSMNTYEVNACYDPQRNEIVFPAGIIQSPFFDKDQSMFKNYGAIGFIIGHEIIHGYDDQGRKYDDQGNIVNWWTDNDLTQFNKIADHMVKQYAKYSIDDHYVNGHLTLGENLADLGGITLALKAVQNVAKNMGVDSTENDVRDFFISFANVWKKIVRPEKIVSRLLSDPHSPGKFRIYILRNLDEFYNVFSSFNSSKSFKSINRSMYLDPEQRIRMW